MRGRVEQAAARRAAALRDELAARMGDAVPGVAVRVAGERVVIEGRGLARRLVLGRAPGWIRELMR